METLPARAAGSQDIVVTRVVNAPREAVFDAWTKPELLMKWWAPKGFSTPSCTVDLRVGGKFHFCMRSPDGEDTWGLGIYREIVRPERIVYTDSFADAAGNVVPATHYGLSAGHPLEALVTAIFDEEAGKTKITLRHAIPVTVEERDGAEQGWGEMLDRLANLVEA